MSISDIALDPLSGPVYCGLLFGPDLSCDFAENVVDALMKGYASPPPCGREG